MSKYKFIFIILFFFSKAYAEVVTIGTVYDAVPDVGASIRTESDYNNQSVGGAFGLVGMAAASGQSTRKSNQIAYEINKFIVNDNVRYLKHWSELATEALNSEIPFFKVDKENGDNKFFFYLKESFDVKKHPLEADKISANHLINVRLIEKDCNKELLNLKFKYSDVVNADINKFVENDKYVLEIRDKSLRRVTDSLYFQLRKNNILHKIANAYTHDNPFVDYKRLLKKASSRFYVEPLVLNGWKVKKTDNFNYFSYPKAHEEIIQIKTEISPVYWNPEKKKEDQATIRNEVALNYISDQLGSDWQLEEKNCTDKNIDTFTQLCFSNIDTSKKYIFYIKPIDGFLIIHMINIIGNYSMFINFYEKDFSSYITNFKFITK